MKKVRVLLLLALVMALSASGCGGVNYSFTTVGSSTTIKVNSAEDGSVGESGAFSVGRGKTAVVESALDRGELQIDFAEATIYRYADGSEDVTIGDVAASVTVGPGAGEEINLDQGDYVLQVTAVGDVNGKVTVKIG